MKNRYPIYIISKGRWESRQTSKALERMNIPYLIAVEPQEYDKYASVIDSKKILVTPFSNLGQGSIPVRNFVWEHSIENGHKRHWLIDDNILKFYRLNRNRRIPTNSVGIFCAAEDFTDRYTNIAFSGFNNLAFAPDRNDRIKPFLLNTRIYSMTLLNNEVPYRWRGFYNEDTDLCLRALKDGWVTIQFNAFLGDKATTLKMKGGNTEEVYGNSDNRLKFAQSLKDQHPDVVDIVWKFNRYHHQVNYKAFKNNKLIRKDGIVIEKGINNYGMVLKDLRK